jgi:outer membrane protein TolC
MRFLGASAILLFLVPALARAQEPAPAQPGLETSQLEAASAPTMGLSQAIGTALARNPTAVVAYEEIRRAESLVEQTRTGALPTLYGNGALTQLDGARAIGGSVVTPATALLASATLTVPLIVPKPWAQWSQAKDQVEAARSSAADTRRLVAVAVARAYLTIVAQKRVIEAAMRARDTDRAHYSFAHQRFIGGVGNRLDEVRAEQQVQSDEANVQLQYANLARDREALGVLVGVGGPLDAEEPNLQAPSDPAQAMKDAEHRSDVVAADVRVRASEHAIHDNWTDYSPYLTGTFMPFYATPSTINYPTTGWEAQLLLTVPFYDAGLRYGQQKQRDVVREEAQAQLEATVRQARSDVRTAFEELKRADATLAASRQAAQLAHSALELANMSYRAGASTDIEVIDAERTARDAETAVAVAEDGARQARLDLLAATGRFP